MIIIIRQQVEKQQMVSMRGFGVITEEQRRNEGPTHDSGQSSFGLCVDITSISHTVSPTSSFPILNFPVVEMQIVIIKVTNQSAT